MPRTKPGALVRIAVCTLGWLTALLSGAAAEHLPIRTYTTADGLANNAVNRIVRDSRGFLWFCTREGLSRFDGYSFINYGMEQGLPSAYITDLLETREGVYWVATAEGLCRFNPLGKPRVAHGQQPIADQRASADAMFTVYFPGDDVRSRYVLTVVQDHTGIIWCGTRNGLYRVGLAADEVKVTSVDLGILDYLQSRTIECLLEDRRGALWIGANSGLYRRWGDGRLEAYTKRDGLPDNEIRSLLEDRAGQIWIGMPLGGLCRLVPDPVPGGELVARAYSVKGGLPTFWINRLFQASDNTLWAGSNVGLIRLIPTADGHDFRFRVYAEPHGLSYHEVETLAEDGNGNLWVGMQPGGAAKIARSGFTTFDKADGLFWAGSILETRLGELLVAGAPKSGLAWFINRFDAEKFIPIRPQFPETVERSGLGWGWNQTVLEDHTGEWWIATANGVCRFPKVSNPDQLARTPPKATYTTRDGLSADMILRLFEDSRGDVWIGSVGQGKGPSGLSRWERSTNTLHHYSDRDGLPPPDSFYVSSFAEDAAGNLWIGFSGDGGLVRYRKGTFSLFTTNDGLPPGAIRNLLIDSAGQLWAASYRGGLSRIDDPAADRPIILTYTTADGLSSNEVTALSEDQWGRIYIANGRGIDRLDPRTGRIKHYTTADGLPMGEVVGSLRDRTGALWFSLPTGLARLVPEPDPRPTPPPILITGLRIAGDTVPISALGEVEIPPFELSPNSNQLQIAFVALGFSPGEGLRYQYRLEGASEQWSQPADQRTVNFANLAPGRYRFMVQAVNADGVVSETAASFSFRILHPIWQRWWFLTIAALAMAVTAYSIYRYRVTRLVELERMRTRIAADLHDDIGANLTKISILSEVAHQQLGAGDRPAVTTLSSIATISRESVASMRDIIWAINPKRDRLVDLARRMRGFASDIFTNCNIEFQFHAPERDRDLRLSPEVRRDVFLIFKEAVNNVVRHSECTRAKIEMTIEGRWIALLVSDDGKGFEMTEDVEGQGLASMRRRAQSFGGRIEIISHGGNGTTIKLLVPVG